MHEKLPAEPAQTDLNFFTEEVNQRLEQKSMSNANRAFNLGCMIGSIPAGASLRKYLDINTIESD